MPSETKLEAAIRRYAHQTERLGTFLQVIRPDVVSSENKVAMEVMVDVAVVMAVTYLDEYLNSIVGMAAFHQPELIKRFIREHGSPEEQALLDSGKDLPVMRLARARVSFKKRGRKLEQIFDTLFGISPWPDDDSGRLIRDLVRVRNVIVHSGGWPNEEHASDVETPGLIVVSNKFFYKLNTAPYLTDMLRAPGQLAVYVEGRLLNDIRYRL